MRLTCSFATRSLNHNRMELRSLAFAINLGFLIMALQTAILKTRLSRVALAGLLTIMVAVYGTGCASLGQRFDYGHAKLPYPGVRRLAEAMANPYIPPKEGEAGPGTGQLVMPFGYMCAIVDLPLSAAFDTLCLPVDLTKKDKPR